MGRFDPIGLRKCIQAGENAPDFTLKDHTSKEFSLSDFIGKQVVLSFHPLAWTSVCAKQMQSLEKNWKVFAELNTLAVGISVDSVPSKQAWAKTLGIKQTRLLSDLWPHGQVAQQYGIFRDDDGFSERATIILNENHRIESAQIYELSELPDIDEVITVLKTMQQIEI
jgi:peroxiredoxin